MRALGSIDLQRISELRADGNKAGLVELGVAYGEERVGQVDIVESQAPCLAEAQPRAVEKQQQRPQGIAVQPKRAPSADIDGGEQVPQLVTGVHVGRQRPRPPRFIIACRKRRPDHVAAADRVAEKAGQGAVLDGPIRGERPFAGQKAENVRFADGVAADVPTDMLAEPMQQASAGLELGPMCSSPGDVVGDGIPESHTSPSRSMSATSRSVPICTLA